MPGTAGRRPRPHLLAALAIVLTGLPGAAAAQARPPLPVAADSTGALSAIRAIDLRQLCRCPVVLLDSTVRRSTQVKMFDVLDQPAAFSLSRAAIASLRLARHRPVGAALRSMTRARRDTILAAVQLVPTAGPGARFLIVLTPPNAITSAFLVRLHRSRAAWRVDGVRSVLEP